MSKRPWLKFYPGDWLSDVPLKSCSAAAQGLWIGMIAIMHSARPPGCLVVNDQPMSEAMLAAQTGIPAKEVTRLLAELEAASVFSRRNDGAIYSRRMIRDGEKAERDKANGSAGGNPRLIGRDNPRDNGGVNPGVGGGVKAYSLWPLQEGETSKGSTWGSEGSGSDEAPFGREGRH